MTNCPNCGAPIVSDQCEYCGTVFYRRDNIVKLKLENQSIANEISMNLLYEEALKAMRRHGY